MQYFLDGMANRITTLTLDTLNEMFSQLLWSLTRAELFFRPVRCQCGRDVPTEKGNRNNRADQNNDEERSGKEEIGIYIESEDQFK